MQLEENAVIDGRFRLTRLLGQGGMGAVWQATQLALDSPCAVKFIEGSAAQSPDARARFEREAKAAAQLKSPHVVQMIDYGIFEGVPWMAMELMQGEDLGARIARFGRLPPAEVHKILSQVCRALTKAHGMGIVHRDLKPDNIFLVHDDDREIAKVLDFGIAKQQHAELGGGTKTGAMLGTPYYMSPEQAQGNKAVDHRADLWSIAVIAFQALTGRLPFESDALGDLLIKIIVNPLPVPSHLGQVPPGFDAWWLRAASRDPNGRFQSAKEFADSLGVVCGVSQISAVMDRASLLGAGTIPSGAASALAPPPRDPPSAMGVTPSPMSATFAPGQEPRGKRSNVPLFVGAGVTAWAAAMVGIFLFLRSASAPVTPAAAASSPSPAPSAAAPPPEPSSAPVAAAPATGAPVGAAPVPSATTASSAPATAPPPASPPQVAAPASPRPASKPKPSSPKAPADLGF